MTTMVDFHVDDQFADHPKVVGLPDHAVALWVRTGSWAARNHTDGYVPDAIVGRYCARPRRIVATLVDAGLWEVADGGYRFHDWPDYNPTRSALEDRKAADRNRKRRSRTGGMSRRDSERNPSGVTPEFHRDSERNPHGIRSDVSQGVPIPPLSGGGNPPGRAGARARVGGASTQESESFLPTTERETNANATKARERADARARAISACSRCDSSGYIGTQVCDHGLAGAASADTRASAMAAIRSSLGRTSPTARPDGAP